MDNMTLLKSIGQNTKIQLILQYSNSTEIKGHPASHSSPTSKRPYPPSVT